MILHEQADREAARREAIALTCLRGTIAVVLRDPDGEIVGHWDRYSNIAHHLSREVTDGA